MSKVAPFQFKPTHPPEEGPIESEVDEGEDYPQACTSSVVSGVALFDGMAELQKTRNILKYGIYGIF